MIMPIDNSFWPKNERSRKEDSMTTEKVCDCHPYWAQINFVHMTLAGSKPHQCCLGDPWIHICNGNYDVYLFLSTVIMFC